jgi:hypothetical protein
MIATAEYAREWFTCAYDLFDRLPGADAREARDTVWSVSDALADDATPEECTEAFERVRELVQSRYLTTDRVARAILILARDYVADGVAEEMSLLTPTDHVDYARNVLTLPGQRTMGGYPIDYQGSDSDIAFVTVVAATDAMISEALGK